MELRTFHTVYQVLNSGKTRQGGQVYLCRKESSEQVYQIFCMEKRFLRDTTVIFLNQELKNTCFDDFEDLFLYEEKLYIVMRYHEGKVLQEKLKEGKMEFEERLAIGQHILEYFMVNLVSPYFCCQSLLPENLIITDTLEVQVKYELDDVETAPGIKEKHVWEQFAKLLCVMWKQECKDKIAGPLETYLLFLKNSEEKKLADVYRKYLIMQEQMKQITKEERIKPRRIVFVAWDWIKKGFPIVKKFLAVLILAAVIFYLGYTIYQIRMPRGEKQNLLHYIGTLQLKE
ncbi:protein kinase family protein [[Clostridium] polysaccharolyticum]|uniref:Protein kinase domain-containing protein n=1 Tax=[Clostridium] polysaccharolyticum TaxID=29364 RepID=A0A1I0CBH0_9FIRM|nr:hypothetical protein [[Clostridium] polysaccharolyticum]SET16325.1 hypothetical protein SAMN04487772_10991 [[Clostridium] polysaccharolyticum]